MLVAVYTHNSYLISDVVAYENHVIHVDYMKCVISQENHRHIMITSSRLATN